MTPSKLPEPDDAVPVGVGVGVGDKVGVGVGDVLVVGVGVGVAPVRIREGLNVLLLLPHPVKAVVSNALPNRAIVTSPRIGERLPDLSWPLSGKRDRMLGSPLCPQCPLSSQGQPGIKRAGTTQSRCQRRPGGASRPVGKSQLER